MIRRDAMRQDWDDRARQNAFYYIASWRSDWDLDSFLASGEEDYEKMVAAALSRCAIPAGGTMIEIGCGAGRMTGSFARRFARVYAVDLSPAMLGRARRIHAERKNVLWLRGNGADLSCLRTACADFVFSYLVLQHLPQEPFVITYIREMLRVLRPGGAFLFQFNANETPTMNWRGRAAWGLVDALWSLQLTRASRATASLIGLDPALAGKSWRGAAVRASRVMDAVQEAGGEVRELSGEGTPMAWCCGRKRAV